MYHKLKSANPVSLTNYPQNLSFREFHLTPPHPHTRKCKHGHSLALVLWTTMDELSVVPKKIIRILFCFMLYENHSQTGMILS